MLEPIQDQAVGRLRAKDSFKRIYPRLTTNRTDNQLWCRGRMGAVIRSTHPYRSSLPHRATHQLEGADIARHSRWPSQQEACCRVHGARLECASATIDRRTRPSQSGGPNCAWQLSDADVFRPRHEGRFDSVATNGGDISRARRPRSYSWSGAGPRRAACM